MNEFVMFLGACAFWWCVMWILLPSGRRAQATSRELGDLLTFFDDLPDGSPFRAHVLGLHAMASQPLAALVRSGFARLLRPRKLRTHGGRLAGALNEADEATRSAFLAATEKAVRVAKRRSVIFRLVLAGWVLVGLRSTIAEDPVQRPVRLFSFAGV